MTLCPEDAMPDFGDSLDDVLFRILTAINVVETMGRSSSAVLDVEIEVHVLLYEFDII